MGGKSKINEPENEDNRIFPFQTVPSKYQPLNA